MKTRKNVRDTFKINDKLSDIKKEQFSIISLEKNEDDINDIKVNYKYFDETLKTNSISFKNKWLYEGVLTSGHHTELVSVASHEFQFDIFGYSKDVELVNPLLSNESIGDINPAFDVSICTEPIEIEINKTGYKFVVFGLIETKDIIVSVNDIEYTLNIEENFGEFSNVTLLDDNIFEDGVDYEIKIKYI